MVSRVALVSVCTLFAIFFVVAVSAQDNGGGRLKNVDVDEVLKNDRLLNNYYKCLMDNGPCTSEATKLKQLIPKAVENKCAECTEVDKQQLKKAITYLQTNKPDYYKNLIAKYDPNESWKQIITQ